MNLHSKYFSEEIPPFSGAPNTVVTQSQHQSQSVSVVMIMEVKSLIDKQLFTNKSLTEKEKGFLEKIKQNLPNIKTAVDLLSTILTIGKTLNLDVSQIMKTLGL